MSRTVPQAGDLRDRITIQRFSETGQDSTGARIGSWVAVGRAWASVRPVGGNTEERDGRATARRRYRLIVRDEIDIRAGDRLLFGAETMSVRAVYPERANARYLVVEATAEDGV